MKTQGIIELFLRSVIVFSAYAKMSMHSVNDQSIFDLVLESEYQCALPEIIVLVSSDFNQLI